MDIRDRFFKAYEYLKENGKIDSLQSLGDIIGTNKAGVSDLKHGRKKISIEHVVSMINSYTEINCLWILTGKGEMINEVDFQTKQPNIKNATAAEEKSIDNLDIHLELILMQKNEITRLKKELADTRTKVKESASRSDLESAAVSKS